MFIGRLIAYLSLILAIMVAGAEGLRILQGQSDQWITIAQVVDFALSNSEDNLPVIMESGWFNMSAFLVFLILSVTLFLVMSWKKR